MKKLEPANFRKNGRISFRVYGVSIGVAAEAVGDLEEVYKHLERVFPNGLERFDAKHCDFLFSIAQTKNGVYELLRNSEKTLETFDRTIFFEAVESQIRVTIAEFAARRVFLHAGVVGWKNRAIVIPAKSFSGKSALVSELIKRGAAYYSDEYAVLDSEGAVEPFPRWLSIRSDVPPFAQTDQPVESFGAFAGIATIPVGMILIARYERNKLIPKRWQPKRLSGGQGILEILPHALSIRNKPKFVLEVLNKLVTRAIIVKTVRGEASEFAKTLLQYFDRHID